MVGLPKPIKIAGLTFAVTVIIGACLGFVVVPAMNRNISAVDGLGIGGAASLLIAVPASAVALFIASVLHSRR